LDVSNTFMNLKKLPVLVMDKISFLIKLHLMP